MAIEHIKVYQIHESKAFKIPGLQGLGKGDAVGVAGGLDLFGHTLAVKDIVDLAHGDHILTGILQQIQHGGAGRLQAQVVAVGGAVEGIRAVAKEGAGDHTTHTVLALEHFPGDLAVAVQFLHRHKLLVGGHLKNAVGAGIDDEGVFPHGLLAVVLQHLRAGIGLVAQHLVAGLLLILPDQLLREALGEGGQRLRADHTGDFPVADGGILAHALLLQAGKGSRRGIRLFPCGHAVNVEQAQLAQVGAIEIGVVRNGTQGVGACIAKGSGVRLCADAKAVQHDQKNAFFHNGHSILRAFPGTVLLYYPYYKQKPPPMQEEAVLYVLISFHVLQQFSPVRQHAESCGASLKVLQSFLWASTDAKTCIQAKIPLALLRRNDYNNRW